MDNIVVDLQIIQTCTQVSVKRMSKGPGYEGRWDRVKIAGGTGWDCEGWDFQERKCFMFLAGREQGKGALTVMGKDTHCAWEWARHHLWGKGALSMMTNGSCAWEWLSLSYLSYLSSMSNHISWGKKKRKSVHLKLGILLGKGKQGNQVKLDGVTWWKHINWFDVECGNLRWQRAA